MTMIEQLALHLTEEQQEEFFNLIEENPDANPMALYRLVLRKKQEY
jgi:uncharacterized protein (DUF1778 family)